MTQSVNNPFRPALGLEPPAWVGCDSPITEWTRAIDSGQQRSASRWTWYSGPVGSGKTTLIRRAEAAALQRGWMVLSLSGRPGMVHRLVTDHLIEAYSLLQRSERSSGWRIGDLGTARPGRPLRVWPALRATVSRLAAELSSRWAGIVVTIDDVEQADPGELALLVGELVRACELDGHDVAVVVAGLPTVVEVEHRGASLGRANWDQWVIGPMDSADSAEALYRPIIEAGRRITDRALAHAVELSGGVPLAIQQVGFLAWEHAPGELTIDPPAVAAAARALAAPAQLDLASAGFNSIL